MAVERLLAAEAARRMNLRSERSAERRKEPEAQLNRNDPASTTATTKDPASTTTTTATAPSRASHDKRQTGAPRIPPLSLPAETTKQGAAAGPAGPLGPTPKSPVRIQLPQSPSFNFSSPVRTTRREEDFSAMSVPAQETYPALQIQFRGLPSTQKKKQPPSPTDVAEALSPKGSSSPPQPAFQLRGSASPQESGDARPAATAAARPRTARPLNFSQVGGDLGSRPRENGRPSIYRLEDGPSPLSTPPRRKDDVVHDARTWARLANLEEDGAMVVAERERIMARGWERLSALVKGSIVRRLMNTTKVHDLRQTIIDTQRLIDDFSRDSKAPLSQDDRLLLERTVYHLKAAR